MSASAPTPAPRALVLTGATGFLGSHLLFRLRHLPGLTLMPIVRARSAAHAGQRVEEALARCAAAYSVPVEAGLGTIRALPGDITLPACGISPGTIATSEPGFPRTIEVWHLAASLNFEERDRASIFAHNLDGTANALDLARQLGASRVVYVSTAYTAGRQRGPVDEVLHPTGAPFNNAYEESKCAAEHQVIAWGAASGTDVRILRPSIVVGPRETLKPGGTTSGLYGFFRELYRMRRILLGAGRTMFVSGEPELPLDLVPVDHVVADMLDLHVRDFPGGPIYHLTSGGGPAIDPALAVLCGLAGVPRIRIGERAGEPFPLEQLLEARTTFYGGYLRNAKRFTRALPARSPVTLELLAGYIREYLQELQKSDRDSVFRPGVAEGVDGSRVCTFEAGDPREGTLVLANAYGMPADIWVPFVQALKGRYRILTWETRGLPNTAGPFHPDTASVDAHAADLGRVLDAHGVRRAALVGWCSGAQVALRFAALHPERVSALVLVNGFFKLPESVPLTPFHRDLYGILPACTRSVTVAQRWCDTLYGSRGAAARDDEQRVHDILHKVDPSLVHMTSAPFRSGEALYRYAHMLMAMRGPIEAGWWRPVPVPAMVLTGPQDTIAHPAGSEAAAAWLPGCELVHSETGDHFAIYHDATLPERVRAFLARTHPVSAAPHAPEACP